MLPTLESPELIFGICSPIGTDNSKVTNLIINGLTKFHYASIPFKVTKLMQSLRIPGLNLVESPLEERYDSYIKYANHLRATYHDPGLLAMLCCGAIRGYRRAKNGKPDSYLPKMAYIFDQFKRKEEVDVLKQIYGRLFILISVYSDREIRLSNLSELITESHSVSRPTADIEGKAKDLIARDENEDGIESGQRLRDTFPLADLFLDIDNVEAATKALDRFLSALFGSYSVSPTPDEYGMYLAKSAALRSLDLSRQVGAAIIAERGDIITLGCNEVPKAGGGSYWPGDVPDERDYFKGRDENDRIKRALLADIVRRLKDRELVSTTRSTDELVEAVLADVALKGSPIREAELMDLLEFGRVIHAEMSALCDAARLGKAVRNATLYCTTFPCHICAKHIIASGINRVIFVEPYPKSYAEVLHRDSIVVRTGDIAPGTVQFEPFIGISPFRYRELFQRDKRKDSSGKSLPWAEGGATPIVRFTVATYLNNETATMKLLLESTNVLMQSNFISINEPEIFGPPEAAQPSH